MKITASARSPDGELRLLRVESEGTVSIGFEGCGWHIHPDAITACFDFPSELSDAEALSRFWSDILSDRLVLSVEEGAAGRFVEVCDDPEAAWAEGLEPGQVLRYWSGKPYAGGG